MKLAKREQQLIEDNDPIVESDNQESSPKKGEVSQNVDQQKAQNNMSSIVQNDTSN